MTKVWKLDCNLLPLACNQVHSFDVVKVSMVVANLVSPCTHQPVSCPYELDWPRADVRAEMG